MGKAKFIRRSIGAVCLAGALLMLVLGEMKPASGPDARFVFYWMSCLVLSALAMAAAILDLGAVRREARREQRELFESTLHDIKAKESRRQTDEASGDR